MNLSLQSIANKPAPDSSWLVDISPKKWYISDQLKNLIGKIMLPQISKLRAYKT